MQGNKGAGTAGIDGRTARSIVAEQGIEEFLDQLRSELKDRSFRPVPVRERMIPKAGGKLRRLGIPTVADRVVQGGSVPAAVPGQPRQYWMNMMSREPLRGRSGLTAP